MKNQIAMLDTGLLLNSISATVFIPLYPCSTMHCRWATKGMVMKVDIDIMSTPSSQKDPAAVRLSLGGYPNSGHSLWVPTRTGQDALQPGTYAVRIAYSTATQVSGTMDRTY